MEQDDLLAEARSMMEAVLSLEIGGLRSLVQVGLSKDLSLLLLLAAGDRASL